MPPQHALTGAEKAQLISQVTSIIGQTLINLPGNTFTTGQTVVYHQGSGSIDGLTDGDTYYVWVDPNNPSRIGLATSPGDVQGATPKTIAFDAATGTGFVLADPHVIDLTASTNPGTRGSTPTAARASSRSTPPQRSRRLGTRSSSPLATA